MSDAKSNLPRARKDQEFYLEIWRHSICGFNANQIAEGMKTSAPTVRRTLKNIGATDSPETYLILARAAQKARVSGFLDYEHFMSVMSNFYYGVQNTEFRHHHACLSECDLRGKPRAFVNKHVRYLPHHFEKYALNFIDFVDIEKAADDFLKFQRCRYCPLKRYRDHALSVFQNNLYLYAYLMVELASTRQRNLSEQQQMKLYFDAGGTYLIHQIVLRVGQESALQGKTDAEIMHEMETSFLDLTQSLWDEILLVAG